MNVAASSIARAQPAAPPSRSGVQSASDVKTRGSFANAMQAVQTKDSTLDTVAGPNSETTSTAADTPAAMLFASAEAGTVSTPVELSAHIQSASLKIAKNANGPVAVNAATDETSMSSDAKDVVSPVTALGNSTGSEPLVQQPGVPTKWSGEAAASQTGSDPVEQGAAPIPEVAIAAATAKNLLTDKQLDGKAVAAGTDKSARKSLHAHEASAGQVAAPPAPRVAGNQAPLLTGELATAASAPQQLPADTCEQALPDTTSTAVATAALKPAATNLFSPHVVPAARVAEPTVQKVDSSPAVQPIDVTPAATQLATAHVATAVESTTTLASSTDGRTDASSAQNVFAGAPALSAATPQPAAVFVPSLTPLAGSEGERRASADLSSAHSITIADSTPDGAMVQAAPVMRLEIAVNDPLLGAMDVRAEMRGGALHASLIGTQDLAAGSIPALHQFLQQHDVTIHTLTYTIAGEGVAATGSAASSSNDAGRETGSRNFGGGTGPGSQQPQGDASQSNGQRYGTSGTGYDEQLFVPAYAPWVPGISPVSNTLPTGSTLSIHI